MKWRATEREDQQPSLMVADQELPVVRRRAEVNKISGRTTSNPSRDRRATHTLFGLS